MWSVQTPCTDLVKILAVTSQVTILQTSTVGANGVVHESVYTHRHLSLLYHRLPKLVAMSYSTRHVHYATFIIHIIFSSTFGLDPRATFSANGMHGRTNLHGNSFSTTQTPEPDTDTTCNHRLVLHLAWVAKHENECLVFHLDTTVARTRCTSRCVRNSGWFEVHAPLQFYY